MWSIGHGVVEGACGEAFQGMWHAGSQKPSWLWCLAPHAAMPCFNRAALPVPPNLTMCARKAPVNLVDHSLLLHVALRGHPRQTCP